MRPTGKAAAVDRPPPRSAWPEWALVGACALLLLAASLPLSRVFIGWEFLRPVGAAIVLSLGGQVVARRAGAGALVGLLVGAVAWVGFVSLVFVPDTLAYRLLPTADTASAGADLFARGVELIQSRPAPTFAEPGLVLLAVTGVWWITHAVQVLAVRLRSPLHAVAAALVMWTVPLAIAPAPGDEAWRQAVPVLAAAVAVVLFSSDRVIARRPAGRRPQLPPLSGWATGATAIVAGALLAGMVPGFDADPLIQPARGGGLTRTDNPIVDIRSDLVDRSDQPVAQVRAPQPVYLRLTSLDVYSANEQWTNDGLSGARISGALPPETEQPISRFLDVEVEPLTTHSALVPAPYQATEVDGPRADDLRWDRDMATLTLATGATLSSGDAYQVTAAVPDPPAEALRDADVSRADPTLTHLPSLPEEVAALARTIVDDAGAATAFDRAMAIQDELRRWDYSLEPEPGHGDSHLVTFIENREGYCEQYAATMAAMLRSLDIPARVAVGYTPGDPVGEDEYVVRGRNAHAWVEVLFPGYGWVSFEPTPRDDLNLLTPSTDSLAPGELDSERAAQEPDELPDVDTGDDDALDPATRDDEPAADGDDEPEAAGGTSDDAAGRDRWWGAGALLAALAGGSALLARRRTQQATLLPAEAVLASLARVERLGAGLARPRRPVDTDAEYIRAVADRADDAEPLVAAVDRARWATTVSRDDVRAARAAERAIRARRLDRLGRPARVRVRLVGDWHAARRVVARRAARLRAALAGPFSRRA